MERNPSPPSCRASPVGAAHQVLSPLSVTTGDSTTRSAAGAPFTIAGLAASSFLSWAARTGHRRPFDFFALAMIETPLGPPTVFAGEVDGSRFWLFVEVSG